MAKTSNCPRCGTPRAADAPAGLCAPCLLEAGLETEAPSDGETRAAMPTPEELTRLLPDLDVHECIGAGGMGAVYRARQLRLDREVAVKILSPDVADSKDFAERFSREARALATLSHPNIVSVHDFGQAGDMVYIVMEYIEGTNLRQVMRAGELDAKQALSIVQKLCDTLQYAHDHGVVHRDIKPENVLVTTKGEIKVVDFGLAKSLRADRDITVTARAMGTPAYMAPEQFEKPETVDHRADIYSLGVVFYELLTGELPLGRFAPPSEMVEIDVRLDEVVLRTLEKERERRYQNAADVKTDIHTVESGGEPSVRPRVVHPTRPQQRRGVGFYVGVLTGCAGLLVLGLAIVGAITAIAVPNLVHAVDRGKQTRTTADLRTISEAAAAYRVEHGRYPDATTFDELREALVPAFAATLPRLDGWARDFLVASDAETFTIGSGAKDGGGLDLVEGGGASVHVDDAIVFVNGEPVQWPASREEIKETAGTWRMGLATMFLLGPLGFLLIVVIVAGLWFFRARRKRRTAARHA